MATKQAAHHLPPPLVRRPQRSLQRVHRCALGRRIQHRPGDRGDARNGVHVPQSVRKVLVHTRYIPGRTEQHADWLCNEEAYFKKKMCTPGACILQDVRLRGGLTRGMYLEKPENTNSRT